MVKQYILFDPRTAERRKITLDLLSGIAGRTKDGLRYALRNKSKIRSLNCYILATDTPISVYRELLAKEVIPDEVWRDIPSSLWQVSSYGRYRSITRCTGRLIYRLPYLENKTQGAMFSIVINGKKEMHLAHYWVVRLFIGEVPKGHVIYHKNGNKADNRIENLGFIRRRELILKQATSTQMKPIAQIDEVTGEILAEYKSIKAAARANFTDSSTIRQAIKENRSAIGFIWMTEEMLLESEVYGRC